LKLLVDENLPARLVEELADLFPFSEHVARLGLASTPDEQIWEFAKANGFAFLTKDKDFANLSFAWGAPPKVILLQMGNSSATRLIQFVRDNAIRFADFDADVRRSLLMLR
jgi:predicted nuclease of predicted toxin-antitoxin system